MKLYEDESLLLERQYNIEFKVLVVIVDLLIDLLGPRGWTYLPFVIIRLYHC